LQQNCYYVLPATQADQALALALISSQIIKSWFNLIGLKRYEKSWAAME
jgi:hypothetical protein